MYKLTDPSSSLEWKRSFTTVLVKTQEATLRSMVLHKVQREDKMWIAEKHLLSSKLHLFSHSNHCILQLHSSRTNSNDEDISVNNSAFSILCLC